MAEVIDKLPVQSRGAPGQWERYADGQVWKLTVGVDVYSQDIYAARMSAAQWAIRKNMKAHFRKISQTEFAVQFVKEPKA